nr:MAG TPA: hypothetical protein [Caudoviricetes sp.]
MPDFFLIYMSNCQQNCRLLLRKQIGNLSAN